MKKRNKKVLALLLAAVMTVTTPGYGVLAAEEDLFTDEFTDPVSVDMDSVSVRQEETDEVFSDGAAEFSVDGIISEDVTADEKTIETREAVASGQCGETANWTLDGEGTLVIAGTGEAATAGWKAYTADIKKVVIENGITSLPEKAFAYYSNLAGEIVLPEGITEIPAGAFDSCSNLTKVTLPTTLTKIGDSAFYDCSGISGEFVLPEGITEIGRDAFYGCYQFTGNLVLPKNLKFVGERAFYDCRNLTGKLVIPEGVTEIPQEAFEFCSKLEGVSLPKGLTKIGESAFYGCNGLAGELRIPENVTEIGKDVFYECKSLNKVILPKNLPVIPWGAFKKCSSMTEIVLPENLTTIGTEAFYDCTNLGNIALPQSVTTIEGGAFCHCESFTEIFLPESVTKIGQGAFDSCIGLTRVVLPDKISAIERSLFFRCSNLKEVYLPAEVKTIDSIVFSGCKKLQKICFKGNVPSVAADAFSNIGAAVTAYVPYGVEEWTDEVKQNYGGTITWETWYPSEDGHFDIVTVPAIEPTCTRDGRTEGCYCALCGEILVESEVIPALGHTEVIDEAVEATCAHTGLTEGSHCSVCDEILVPQEVISKLSHKVEVSEAVEATCSHDGLTEGKYCSACGEVFVAQEVIPALPHTVVIDEAVEPSCGHNGLTEGSHCSVCGETLVKQEVIQAEPHAVVTDKAVEATCAHDGLTEGSHCILCGEVLVAQEVIPALPHTIVIDEGYAETCTKDGLTVGSHCAVCGEIFKAQEVIPAHHIEVIDKAVKETCTKDGLTEGSHCSVCGEILTAQKVIKAHHTVVVDKAVTANCQRTGLTEGSHCSVCETVIKKQTVLPKTDHHYVNGICSVCRHSLLFISGSTVKISKSSYAYTGKAIKPAVTVTKTGKSLKSGVDYKVTYTNNTAPGTANITITGIGKYYGTLTKTFKITRTLKTPTLSSVKNSATGVTVTWKKVTGAAKYQLLRKSAGGSWKRVLETTSTKAVDTTASSGKTYQYTVRCLSTDETVYTSAYNTKGLKCLCLKQPVITSVSSGTTGITVRWKGMTGAKGYTVYRKTSGTSWKKVSTLSSSKRSYTDTAVSSGVKYSYAVSCYNGKTVSTYDTKGVQGSYLAMPVLSGYEVISGGIKVSWKKVAGATGYEVYKKTNTGGWVSAGKTSALSYTDTAVEGGKVYTYTVKAYSSLAVSDYNKTGIVFANLAAPKLVSATNASSGIYIKWGTVTGAQGYQIFRKTSKTSWEKIASVTGGTKTSYTDTKAASGTLYTYTVKATIGTIAGGGASGISCRRLTSPKLAGLEAKPRDNECLAPVYLTWKKVTGATGYYIYRKGTTGDWEQIGKTKTLKYKDTTSEPGTVYYYTVKAYNGKSVSSYNTKGLKCRTVILPRFSAFMSDNSKADCLVMMVLLENKCSSKFRVYSDNARAHTVGYNLFDRNLRLIDPDTLKPLKYVDIAPGKEVALYFEVLGSSTYYGNDTFVEFNFSCDGHDYRASFSRKYGYSAYVVR